MLSVLLVFVGIQLATGAVPITNQRTFGHSVKNGPLPPKTETLAFAHTCSRPPCVITHIHVPSVWPLDDNEVFDWEAATLRIYVDSAQPTLQLSLLELASVGPFGNNQDNVPSDGSPWGIGLMGKTSVVGGVYTTLRVPFERSIRVTIQAADDVHSPCFFWMVVRGLESMPVIWGEFQLPSAARLRLYRQQGVLLKKFDFITLANTSHTAGVLAVVKFDAQAERHYNYLEACLRIFIDGANQPLFLSSGAEDYFMSANYFDEGMFQTPNSGLTFFDGNGTLSAYRVHDRDPVAWSDGMALVWRSCELVGGCGNVTHCPNQFCQNATARSDHAAFPHSERSHRRPAKEDEKDEAEILVTYSTLVWTYEWPSAS